MSIRVKPCRKRVVRHVVCTAGPTIHRGKQSHGPGPAPCTAVRGGRGRSPYDAKQSQVGCSGKWCARQALRSIVRNKAKRGMTRGIAEFESGCGTDHAKQSQTWERQGIWARTAFVGGAPASRSETRETKPTARGRMDAKFRAERRLRIDLRVAAA